MNKDIIQQLTDKINKNISSNIEKLTSLKNIDPTIVLTFANILYNLKKGDYKKSEIKIPTHIIIDFLTVYLANKNDFKLSGEESSFLETSKELVQLLTKKSVLDSDGLKRENIINLLLFPQTVYPTHLLEILNQLYKPFDVFFRQNYHFIVEDYIKLIKQGVEGLEKSLSYNALTILENLSKKSLIDLSIYKINEDKYNKNLLESLAVKKNFEIENVDWDTFLSKCVLESKPLFKYENDFYLMNISRLYYDGIKFFYNKILEVGTKESENIRQDLSKNKFEDLVAKTFQEILPNATIYKSCTYKNGECDILVIFSGTLLIIECKNGFVTDGLKNGGKREWYDDKKDKFQQQIVKPYEQAQRTKDYIFSDNFSGFTIDGKRINLDKNKIDKTFLISVTADYWGNLAAYPEKLKELGVIDFKEKYWAVCLPDLLTIRDLMESPSIFILYLERRLEYMKWTKIESFSSELHLLQEFLTDGLIILDTYLLFQKYHELTHVFHETNCDKIDLYYQTNCDLENKLLLNTDTRFKKFINQLDKFNNPNAGKIANHFLNRNADFHKELMDKLVSKSSWILESNDRYKVVYEKYNSDLEIIYLISCKDFNGKEFRAKIIGVKKHELKINKCYFILIELDKNEDLNIVSIEHLDFDY